MHAAIYIPIPVSLSSHPLNAYSYPDERFYYNYHGFILNIGHRRISRGVTSKVFEHFTLLYTLVRVRLCLLVFTMYQYFFVELSVLLSYGVKNDDTDRTANDMCIARTKRLNPLLLSLDVRSVGVSSKTLSQYRGSKQGDATRYYV